jgi:hypothetical protein
MAITGRCYCGALKYRSEGQPLFRAQCHCRECQYISGGGPNYVMGLPEDSFSYPEGEPSAFLRDDLEVAASREFCGKCGTHILTRSPRAAGVLIMKVGTLDDPAVYGAPQMAMQAADRQPFHTIPEGIPVFERFPG